MDAGSERPQFKSYFRVEIVEPDTVYLLAERREAVLTGGLYCRLAPLLDGRHSVAGIIASLAPVSAPEIHDALARLEAGGYIEAASHLPLERAAFWATLCGESAAGERLGSASLSVRSVGDVAVEPLHAALADLGMRIVSADPHAFMLVLTDDYLRGELAGINSEALANARSWMIAKPVGSVIWLGPVFVHGECACWECLAQRLRAKREAEGVLLRAGVRRAMPVSRAALPSTLQAGIQLAATEAAKYLVAGNSSLVGKVLTFDLLGMNGEHHSVVRRPQCPACGEAKPYRDAAPRPIELSSRRKASTWDGGHWACSPEETWERWRSHVSPVSGIVESLRRHETASASPLHLYKGTFLWPPESARRLLGSRMGTCAGRGLSDAQARVSALCEAIERYSARFTGSEARTKARLGDLSDTAVHPAELLQYSERQYAGRDAWNRRYPFLYVCLPFDEDWTIEWTPLWSLTSERFRHVPTAYCYFDYHLPDEQLFCLANSNGNAAGNNMEEAILQGLLELVERDSTALWWYSRARRPAVDLHSFDVPSLSALLEYYEAEGRELWVLDITTDLGIPAFVAVHRKPSPSGPWPGEELMIGCGAHLDPQIALLRAVSEAGHLWLAAPKSADEFVDPGAAHLLHWIRTARLDANAYLAPDPAVRPRTRADYRVVCSDDIRDDLRLCVELARQENLEVLVLDQTRPDVGVPCAKVVVPGLRFTWARFGPGRLYDLPPLLGWTNRRLGEDELNPWPLSL